MQSLADGLRHPEPNDRFRAARTASPGERASSMLQGVDVPLRGLCCPFGGHIHTRRAVHLNPPQKHPWTLAPQKRPTAASRPNRCPMVCPCSPMKNCPLRRTRNPLSRYAFCVCQGAEVAAGFERTESRIEANGRHKCWPCTRVGTRKTTPNPAPPRASTNENARLRTVGRGSLVVGRRPGFNHLLLTGEHCGGFLTAVAKCAGPTTSPAARVRPLTSGPRCQFDSVRRN